MFFNNSEYNFDSQKISTKEWFIILLFILMTGSFTPFFIIGIQDILNENFIYGLYGCISLFSIISWFLTFLIYINIRKLLNSFMIGLFIYGISFIILGFIYYIMNQIKYLFYLWLIVILLLIISFIFSNILLHIQNPYKYI